MWLALKAIGSGALGLLKLIPWQAWLIGAVVAVGWRWHVNDVETKVYDAVYAVHYADEMRRHAEIAKAKALAADLAQNSVIVTERVVTQYVDRIKIVREKAQTIIREVPVYVTAANDAACPVNNGFVSLWNHANSGTVPGAPTGADAETSGVRLSEIATQHAREAEYCRGVETQLSSLQEWVTEQRALYGDG